MKSARSVVMATSLGGVARILRCGAMWRSPSSSHRARTTSSWSSQTRCGTRSKAAGVATSLHWGGLPAAARGLVYALIPPHEYFTLMHGRVGPRRRRARAHDLHLRRAARHAVLRLERRASRRGRERSSTSTALAVREFGGAASTPSTCSSGAPGAGTISIRASSATSTCCSWAPPASAGSSTSRRPRARSARSPLPLRALRQLAPELRRRRRRSSPTTRSGTCSGAARS